MADALPVNRERKSGQDSNFKTKITRTTVVADSAVSRRLMGDHHQAPGQNMQRHTSKKNPSVAPRPSPPTTPKKPSGTRTKDFQNVHRVRSGGGPSDPRHSPTARQFTTSRPDSALSAYSLLPGIGHSGHDAEITAGVRNLGLNESDRVVRCTSSNADVQSVRRTAAKESLPSGEGRLEGVRTKRSASLSSESSTRKVSRREMRIQQFARRKHSQTSPSIADEPAEGEERLLMAIKLPEGERLERHFRPTDSVTSIVSYAEYSTRRSFSDCHLFVSGVPKRMISDLAITIREAGLGNRTLLYLEEKDE